MAPLCHTAQVENGDQPPVRMIHAPGLFCPACSEVEWRSHENAGGAKAGQMAMGVGSALKREA